MNMLRKVAVGSVAALVAVALVAPPAFALDCFNISKQNQAAGVQVVFGLPSFQPVWMTPGLETRVAAGLVNLNTFEGFSGLVGVDFNGDGVADAATFVVTPNNELPSTAQWNGASCKGIVSIQQAFSTCAFSPV